MISAVQGRSGGRNMDLDAGYYTSFVIRIWSRKRSGGLRHGQITHVATRETAYFTESESVLSFIDAHLEVPFGGAAQGQPEGVDDQ
jgi:hypothetical protein